MLLALPNGTDTVRVQPQLSVVVPQEATKTFKSDK